MTKHLTLVLALAPVLVGAGAPAKPWTKPQWRGTSSAEIRGSSFRTVTTRYELGDPLTVFDLARAFPRASATAVRQQTLYEVTQTEERDAGAEGARGEVKIRALDPAKGKQRWQLHDELANAYRLRPDYFVATTTTHGCCGAQDAHRVYSLLSGKLLFPFSFHGTSGMPIVLRADAFNPRGFRLLGYHNDHWPARDTEKQDGPDEAGLTRGGVFTYASPLGVIDRLAVWWDLKAAGDPASDPEELIVTAGGKDHVFKGGGGASGHEVSYWTEEVRKATTEPQAFDQITVALVFPAGEIVRIPIKGDRVDEAGVTMVGKYVKKVAALPLETIKKKAPAKPVTKP